MQQMQIPSSRPPWNLLIVFLLAAILISAIGGGVYLHQRKNHSALLQKSLIESARVKALQVEDWHRNHLRQAHFIAAGYFDRARADQPYSFDSAMLDSDYLDIILLHANGRRILGASSNAGTLNPEEQDLILKAERNRSPEASLFRRNTNDPKLHLGLAIPIFRDPNHTTDTLRGVLLLRLDSDGRLNSILSSSAITHKSGQFLLLDRSSRSVVFSGKRFIAPDASAAVILAEADPVEYLQISELKNSKKRSIVATIAEIPSLKWDLILTVDGSDLYAPLRAQAIDTLLLVLVLILASGIAIAILWRYQSARYYRERYQSSLEMQALERQYQNLTRYANDIIILADEAGVIIDANDRAFSAFGYSRIELMGLNVLDLYAPNDVQKATQQIPSGHEIQGLRFEAEYRRKDGSLFPAESRVRIIEVEGLKLQQSILRDISDHRKAEQALRESEQILSTVFRETPAMISISTATDGRYIEVNDAFVSGVGFPRKQLIGSSARELGILSNSALQELFPEGSGEKRAVRGREVVVTTKNNRRLRCLASVAQVHIQSELCLLTVLIDVTELKKTEEALRSSQERHRSLVQQVPVGIFETNNILRLNLVNQQLCLISGTEENEILSQPADVLFHADDRKRIGDLMEESMESGMGFSTTCQFGSEEAGYRWVMASAMALRDEDGDVMGLLGTVSDISERKRFEDQLAAEKEQLQVTLRSIGDGVITTDVEGRVILMNRVAEDMTGWMQDQARGEPLEAVFCTVERNTESPCETPIAEVLRTGNQSSSIGDVLLLNRNGKKVLISDSAAPIRDHKSHIVGVVLVFRDITEREKAASEAQRTQKLESLGTLAGGIAHDFNNLLTAIIGNISLAQMAHLPPENLKMVLHEAEKASKRAKDLAQQLLTFSKGGAPVRKMASVAELVRDSSGFATHGSHVLCQYDLPGDLWQANIDEGQVSQVIQNLAINAVEASPDGGSIFFHAENVSITPASGERFISPGDYVRLTVRDTGVGIPEMYLHRVFDPYFTTKQKGSGLGLATCHSIITRHEGHISVQSRIGEGTTFTIYLPAQRDTRAETSADDRPDTGTLLQQIDPGSCNGKILVMDDEEIIRTVCSQMLEQMGYTAEQAADGREALDIYERALKSGDPFDVVIMDLTIPGGMGGKETIERLLEMDPEACAIVSSGYSNDPILAHFQDHGFRASLVKPYRVEDLLDVFHSVMEIDSEMPAQNQ